MSNMHITTTQRTIAYLSLSSQLLTSCGLDGTIFPSKEVERPVQQEKNIAKIIMQEEPTQEEQEVTQTQIVGITTELAIDKKTEFFEFQTKGGYQVSIQDGASKAIVKETIGNFSKERELPVYNPFNEDLKNLSQQGKLSQQYRVHINPSHVLIGKLGLVGGVKSIRVDVQEVINGVKGGYAKLNRQAETLTAWMPFINAFTSALSHINFTLQLPSDPTTLNPGNIRDQFIQMTRQIMQRNVQLDNYGLAWYNLISEVRNQINREKNLDIDPSQYPLDSYSITLKPNADKMIPLIGEMDKLYRAKLNSNIDLDFTKLLGFADVMVNFESSFYEFEQKKLEELAERSRQEQEKREKEEKKKSEKEEASKEEENLECIKFDPGVKGDFVSLYSRKLLARAARASNNPLIYITSTARDAVSQAHAMFSNLERNVALQRRTYRAPGQAVIDVYENMKADKASASEIKSAMIKKINELGPSNVSTHCADFNILNVVDISIARLAYADLFKSTIISYPRGVRLLDENEVFHVEIEQP